MPLKHLHIKAGPIAKKTLVERGLQASDVRIIPAAAGGPKWLVLYHLDKYIFGDWLTKTDQKIHLIGSSAGAWRMACAIQENRIEAFDKFREFYSEQTYKEVPTQKEISDNCKVIIHELLGTNGKTQILNAKRYSLNVVTSSSKFEYQPDKLKRKILQAASHNLLSRRYLNKYFNRNIFSTHDESLIHDDEIQTHLHRLTDANMHKALLATGAIPTVIEPVRNINGDGLVHWDGGITDYHLDLNYQMEDGIVLYPHFHHSIIPGWFDKYIKIRKAKKSNLDRTVLIYPSKEFLDSLPRGLIPTRKDFEYYFQKDEERIKYWAKIVDKCKYLVDDFIKLSKQTILSEEINSF